MEAAFDPIRGNTGRQCEHREHSLPALASGPVAKATAKAPLSMGRRLDALVTRTVPNVRKAVKWNSPFYGVEGQGWFLSFHCFNKYLKVTFFNGAALDPPPPVDSRDPKVRYVHIHEGENIDETRLKCWIEQAAALPGWMMQG